jgi:cephalosporin-C deacetylase-like acetyl esterase
MPSRFLKTIFAAGVMIFGVSGYASVGPGSIGPDRIDYIQEISDSWKKQMLLNIVKLRYFDAPTFLDVSLIIKQYGTEDQVNMENLINSGWSFGGGADAAGAQVQNVQADTQKYTRAYCACMEGKGYSIR